MAVLRKTIGDSVMRYTRIKAVVEGVAIATSSEIGHLEYASDTTITSEEVASDVGEVFGEVLFASGIPLKVCC
jgi:hypothetical protein